VWRVVSLASPVEYLELAIQTLKVGSIGTMHTLGLAKAKGARFLVASTSEVYGDPQVHPQPEGYWGHVNPVGPRGVYDEAKRFAEALTMAYHRFHGVETRIVRIFNTYGPRMRPGDGRVVSNFRGRARCWGGSPRFPWCSGCGAADRTAAPWRRSAARTPGPSSPRRPVPTRPSPAPRPAAAPPSPPSAPIRILALLEHYLPAYKAG